MTKVLFVGPYREKTGWGVSARNFVQALDKICDLTIRPVKLNPLHYPINERLRELEEKSAVGCDTLIANVLPHHFSYSGNFKKNILMFYYEGSGIENTFWSDHLAVADELWVTNNELGDELRKAGYNTKVFPCPLDFQAVEETPFNKIVIPPTNGTFKFYFIGELIKRKRIARLVEAFHLAFRQEEPVSLVIKTGKYGHSPAQVRQEVEQICRAVKNGLRLYPHENDYIPEVIITDSLDDQSIINLHRSMDCFASASYCEGWGLSEAMALAVGNNVVSPAVGGPRDFLPEQYCELVPAMTVEPMVSQEIIPNMFTAREEWYGVSSKDLADSLRNAYEHRGLDFKKERQEHARKIFDIDVVAELLAKELGCC